MKKVFTLGLALITLIYVAPFFYNAYDNSLSSSLAVSSVTKNTDIPSDDSRIKASLFSSDSSDAEQNSENSSDPSDTTKSSDSSDSTDSTDITTYSSKRSYKTIKSLIDGTVQEIPLETYVAGVVAAEMPASFPSESLKAQAIAARTYLVYKMDNSDNSSYQGADVCDDSTRCTAYTDLSKDAESVWGSNSKKYLNAVKAAVKDTKGQIMTYNGSAIVAVFHAASGDLTESATDVWGSNIPYLQSVTSEGGDACSAFHAKVTVSASEFRKRMADVYNNIYLKGAPNTWFTASNRSKAGGIITATCGGITVKGSEIRKLFDLNSTNFTLKTTDDSITFITTGYGHGVGMSQYGARQMALNGKTYKQILTHYYTNIKIEKIGN